MRLGDLMTKHGSDKDTWHNYCDIYERLIVSPSRLFEMGIGKKPPAASLKAWAEFFPNAEILGADINERLLYQSRRIKTFVCDQEDTVAIRKMWKQIGPVDVIVDDGSHKLAHQWNFFEHSFRYCRQYFIEDVLNENVSILLASTRGQVFSPEHPTNNLDNNLIYVVNESGNLAR